MIRSCSLLISLLLLVKQGVAQGQKGDFIYAKHLGAQNKSIPDVCILRGNFSRDSASAYGIPLGKVCYLVGRDIDPLLNYLARKGKMYNKLVNEEAHGTFSIRYRQAGVVHNIYMNKKPFKTFLKKGILLENSSKSEDYHSLVALLKELQEELTPFTKKELKKFTLQD